MARLSTGALIAAASALAYGSLGVLAHLAYEAGWNTPSLLAARFTVAALFVLPFAFAPAARGSWRGWTGAFLVGAVGYAATTAFFFPSLRLLPVAVASFLLFLAPAFIAVLSHWFLRERMTRRGWVALALALAGLATIASGAFSGRLPVLGVLFAIGSAVAYSLTVLASRAVVRGIHWTRASTATCAGAATTYILFATGTGRLSLPDASIGLLWALGIGTIATGVALSLFYAALARIGAPRTAVVSTLEPVSTLVFAAMFIDQVPAWQSIAGGALIVGAAALVALETGVEEGLPAAAA